MAKVLLCIVQISDILFIGYRYVGAAVSTHLNLQIL